MGKEPDEHAKKKEAIETRGQGSAAERILRRLNEEKCRKLPPSHPNWDPGWPDYCDDDRVLDLPLWAFSKVEHAISNQISSKKKKTLVEELEAECSDVKGIVSRSVRKYKHVRPDQTLDYLRDVQRYCRKLVDFVEESMHNGNLDRHKCHRMIREYCDLLDQDIQMLSTLNDLLQKTSAKKTSASGKAPNDLIDLAKAVELYQRSRAQLKRDIEGGTITDYRKTKKGKHWISRSEADNSYISK